MIEIKLPKNFSLCVDFTFFAVIALFLCLDRSGYGILGVAACAVHEAGHLTVMLIKKQPPAGLSFYGGGIKIIGAARSNSTADFAVLIAGSAANFVTFFLVYFFTEQNDIFVVLFALMNLIIGIFNLLPISFLDGKRLLEILFIRLWKPETALKALKFAEISAVILVSGLSLFFVFTGFINFTAVILLIYLLTVEIISRL